MIFLNFSFYLYLPLLFIYVLFFVYYLSPIPDYIFTEDKAPPDLFISISAALKTMHISAAQ